MNQYERIVSYIYQYNRGEKGANVGYAKVEKRGNQCRISVQMRAVSMREIPKVYLYKQMQAGIRTIPAGQMVFRGNSLLWKESCDADKLFGSDWGIEDADGIFIDGSDAVYFATTWKNDGFYRGNWNANATNVGEDTLKEDAANPEKESTGEDREPQAEEKAETADSDTMSIQKEDAAGSSLREERTGVQEEEHLKEEEKHLDSSLTENIRREEVQNGEAGGQAVLDNHIPSPNLQENKSNAGMAGKDLQMQSICGVCPFKRKSFDYGKKILMTFPSMKPFENGVARACVRMELQDIGCLPIASWSLSGNRFLLHGYYCYRHLLFAQLINGKYVLGVPGIYSEKERRNAVKFGFSDFQSIGDFGMQQGVFGYWFLELPEGNSAPPA